MEIKKGELVKVVCRYQQYRAVGKILDRWRTGKTPFERSGVIWHTQGSGEIAHYGFSGQKNTGYR